MTDPAFAQLATEAAEALTSALAALVGAVSETVMGVLTCCGPT